MAQIYVSGLDAANSNQFEASSNPTGFDATIGGGGYNDGSIATFLSMTSTWATRTRTTGVVGARTGDKFYHVTGVNPYVISGQFNHALLGSTSKSMFCQVGIRIVTPATSECAIFGLITNTSSPGSCIIWVTIDSSNVLRLYDEDGQITGTTQVLFGGASGWNYLELHADTTGSSGSHIVQARLNGRQFAASSTRALSANLNGFAIGSNLNISQYPAGGGGGGLVYDFDDIVVNDSTGSVCNSWPGGTHVQHLLLSAGGSSNTWNAIDSGGSSHPPSSTDWQYLVDFGGSAHILSATVNATDLFNFSNMTTSGNINIKSVAIEYSLVNVTGSTDVKYRPIIRDPANVTLVRSTSDIAVNDSQRIFNTQNTNAQSYVFYTDPNSQPWTVSQVNNCEYGITIGSNPTGSVDAVECYGMDVVVAYTDDNEYSRFFI